MNNASLVSVIMPFFNTPIRFFKEAVESVFAQEYENWELFLIDDGSRNESTELAKTYAAEYPAKVKYLEHENHGNRGPSASRNLGIRSSRGELIAFLDSDDIWLPMKLEEQLAIMRGYPEAGMSYGKSRYWWSWAKDSDDKGRDRIQEHAIPGNRIYGPPELLKLFLCGKAAIPCPNSVMVRREAVQDVEGFDEDVKLSIWEDQAFYAKVCLENRVFVAENCWDLYRQHSGSSCAVTGKSGETKALHLIYLKWLEAYLDRRGFRNTEIWKTLQREMWLQKHWKLGRRVKRAERFIGRLKGTYPLCTAKKP